MSEKARLLNHDTALVHCDWYRLLIAHGDVTQAYRGDDPDVERVMAERSCSTNAKTPRRINKPPSTAPLSRTY